LGSNPFSPASLQKNCLRFSEESQNPLAFFLVAASLVGDSIIITQSSLHHTQEWCIPVIRGFFSLKFFTTSSHAISSRSRCKEGDLGFLLPKKNPLYLKVTISPTLGVCLLINSVVPGAAVKVTPFGLRCIASIRLARIYNRTRGKPTFRTPRGHCSKKQ